MKFLIVLFFWGLVSGCATSKDFYGKDEKTGTLAWAQVYDEKTVLNLRTKIGEITEQDIEAVSPKQDFFTVTWAGETFVLLSRPFLEDEFDKYSFEKKFYKHKIKTSGPYDAIYRGAWSSPPDPFVE